MKRAILSSDEPRANRLTERIEYEMHRVFENSNISWGHLNIAQQGDSLKVYVREWYNQLDDSFIERKTCIIPMKSSGIYKCIDDKDYGRICQIIENAIERIN